MHVSRIHLQIESTATHLVHMRSSGPFEDTACLWEMVKTTSTFSSTACGGCRSSAFTPRCASVERSGPVQHAGVWQTHTGTRQDPTSSPHPPTHSSHTTTTTSLPPSLSPPSPLLPPPSPSSPLPPPPPLPSTKTRTREERTCRSRERTAVRLSRRAVRTPNTTLLLTRSMSAVEVPL